MRNQRRKKLESFPGKKLKESKEKYEEKKYIK